MSIRNEHAQEQLEAMERDSVRARPITVLLTGSLCLVGIGLLALASRQEYSVWMRIAAGTPLCLGLSIFSMLYAVTYAPTYRLDERDGVTIRYQQIYSKRAAWLFCAVSYLLFHGAIAGIALLNIGR